VRVEIESLGTGTYSAPHLYMRAGAETPSPACSGNAPINLERLDELKIPNIARSVEACSFIRTERKRLDGKSKFSN
jgi:hypothetical protein